MKNLRSCILSLVWAASATVCAEDATAPGGMYVPSYDGAAIPAAILKPAGEGSKPAILFLHGGVGGSGMEAMRAMLRGPVPQHFLKRGYVIMAGDYRRFHFGEDEIQDVLAEYYTLAADPAVDKNRIAIIGGSHGGYLAQMVAARINLSAAVALAGLSDIEGMFFDDAQVLRAAVKDWDDYREKLYGGATVKVNRVHRAGFGPTQVPSGGPDRRASKKEPPAPNTPPYEVTLDLAWNFGARRELYRAISPKNNVQNISSPVLFLVGGEDDLRFEGKKFIEALRARGVTTAEYSEHAGMPHGFYWGQGQTPPKQFFDALEVMTRFVDKYAHATR